MRINIKHISVPLIFALSSIFSPAATGAVPVAKAAVAKTEIQAGDTTTLTIDITGEFKPGFQFVDTALTNIAAKYPDLEITVKDKPQTTDLGRGRTRIQSSYLVQPFDSGLYVVPQVFVVSDSDTVFTPVTALKVNPTLLDSTLLVKNEAGQDDLTIHEYTDLETVEKEFIDYFPEWVINWGWWLLLAVVAIGLLIFVYMKWLRHGKIPLIPAKKPIPPYELAMSELDKLHSQQLWQRGNEKEYYTRLTDILRQFIQGRFGVNAKEMTSTQILNALNSCDSTVMFTDALRSILESADFVKFAKAKPLADENEDSFNLSVDFVEANKPVEEPAKNDSDTNAADTSAETGTTGEKATELPPVEEDKIADSSIDETTKVL